MWIENSRVLAVVKQIPEVDSYREVLLSALRVGPRELEYIGLAA